MDRLASLLKFANFLQSRIAGLSLSVGAGQILVALFAAQTSPLAPGPFIWSGHSLSHSDDNARHPTPGTPGESVGKRVCVRSSVDSIAQVGSDVKYCGFYQRTKKQNTN